MAPPSFRSPRYRDSPRGQTITTPSAGERRKMEENTSPGKREGERNNLLISLKMNDRGASNETKESRKSTIAIDNEIHPSGENLFRLRELRRASRLRFSSFRFTFLKRRNFCKNKIFSRRTENSSVTQRSKYGSEARAAGASFSKVSLHATASNEVLYLPRYGT